MKRRIALGVVLWLATACAGHTAQSTAPEARLDPHYNPAVTQGTIDTTICVAGWTKRVRPPVSYTKQLKLAQLAALPATADHNPADYEEDHLVPLEVGGAPRNPVNLHPELWAEAHAKDVVENRVHQEVCDHTITLAAGRRCFVTDWTTCPV